MTDQVTNAISEEKKKRLHYLASKSRDTRYAKEFMRELSNTKVDEMFLKNMLSLLLEFHYYQLEYSENGKPPYSYDTLGLAEWMEFCKGVSYDSIN